MNLAFFRSPRVIILLLTVALAAMTAPRVFTAPLWGDELRTWRDGLDRPLITVLTWQHNPDHAPLGHLLARGGAAIFGVHHPWALRLGAWLCGLACVAALWRLGRRVHSDAAGCLMALMFVVDSTQVFQITQARMYPPMILASIVALTLAATLLDWRTPSLDDRDFAGGFAYREWFLALGIGVAIGVGIWAHAQIYAVVLALIIAAIVHLFRRSPVAREDEFSTSPGEVHATRWVTSLALLVAVIIGLGIGYQGVAKLVGNRDKAAIVDTTITLERPPEQLEDASQSLTGHNLLTAMIVVGTVGGLWIVGAKRGFATAVLLGATIAFAVVNLLIAARYRPVAHARYLAIAQPPIWCAVAVLLVEIARRPALRRGQAMAVPIVTFVGFAGLCGFQLWRTIESLPAHPLAGPFLNACQYVLAHREAGSRTVVLPGSPLRTYARYYGLDVDVALDDAVTKMPKRERRQPSTRPALAGDQEIWLIGITPTSTRWRGTGDDPLIADATIARARRQSATTLPTTTDLGRREVIVVRYPADGGAGERIGIAGRSSPAVTIGAEE